MAEYLPTGKLPADLMKELLGMLNHSIHQEGNSFQNSNNVVIFPQIGQDTGMVQIEDKIVVVKSNPITFATEKIAKYAVTINANDIASSGAIPRWFSAIVLLPENKTDEILCRSIFSELGQECQKIGVNVISGHTEITPGLSRPIIAGTMFGTLENGKQVTTFGAKSGEALFLTKSIAIEGTAIIANEKCLQLKKKGFSEEEINIGKSMLIDPGISIVKEALFLAERGLVTSMHGPTEGGLAMAAVELARNSGCGIELIFEDIPIHPITSKFCSAFNLEPIGTISSGCLLFSAKLENSDFIIQELSKIGIPCRKIGRLTDDPHKFTIISKEGINHLEFSEVDEITRIFE